jgi:hypothetical protein
MDLLLIHVYSVTSAIELRRNIKQVCRLPEKHCSITIPAASYTMNSVCIYRVLQGHNDTLFRMMSLYVCAYHGLYNCSNEEKGKILDIGYLACALFLLDDKLYGLGHPLFHVILGPLQHRIINLMQ